MFRQSVIWQFVMSILVGGRDHWRLNITNKFSLLSILVVFMLVSCPSITFGQAKPTRNTAKDVVRFNISPKQLSFGSDGGTKTIQVTADDVWSIIEKPLGWATATKIKNTLSVAVQKNTSSSDRSTVVKIKCASKTIAIPIEQQGTLFRVSKSSLSFPDEGGSKTISVDCNADWSVSAYPNDWGHLTRNGNVLTLRVDPNQSQNGRSDYFILRSGDNTMRVDISQEGKKRTEFNVSKTSLTFSAGGGSETVFVENGGNWVVSVYPNDWCHLSRNGNTLTLKVDANSSSSSRTDYFKLKSGSQEIKVNVSQSGSSYSSSPYLNVTKTEMFFASEGGQESITISTNNTWKISTNTNSWGHLKQEGNTLTLSVDANYTGNQRTDYFVLSAGGVDKRINITQSQTYAKNGVSMSGSTRAYTDNATGLSYLTTCIKGWEKCRLGAITESGAGVAVYGGNGYATTGNLNSSFVAKIKELNGNKETIKSVTATSSGYYCIVYGRNGWYGFVPEDMNLKLNQFNNDREDIYCVSIAENGDFVIITDKHIYASNSTDKSNLNKASDKYGHIKYACVTNRALVVICQNGIFYSNIPTNLEVKLKSISFKPDKITFTDSGTYLITNENETYSYHM